MEKRSFVSTLPTLVLLIGTYVATCEANTYKGDLLVTVLTAQTMKETDGWLGLPDFCVQIHAFGPGEGAEQDKATAIFHEYPIGEPAPMYTKRTFKQFDEWKSISVTLLDDDTGEYGEDPAADVLLDSIKLDLKKARGTLVFKDDQSEVVLDYKVKN